MFFGLLYLYFHFKALGYLGEVSTGIFSGQQRKLGTGSRANRQYMSGKFSSGIGVNCNVYNITFLYFSDIGLRNARLNFRQQEENHLMENIIYNELLRCYNVGVVELREKNSRKQLEVDFA